MATHLHENHQEVSENQSAALAHGVSELQELQTRVKAIEKAVMEMEKLAMLESLDTKAKLEAAMKEIKELESRNSFLKGVQTSKVIVMQPKEDELGDEPSDDVKVQKTEPETSTARNVLLMKDIPLDQVSNCSSYEHGVGPNGMSKKGHGQTDEEMLELWETAELDCSLDPAVDRGQKLASAPTEGDIEYHQIEAVEEQKSEYPSSELQVEKELSVDKLKVSRRATEPNQEGKRKILERLASDAQKLLNLQITVEELKNKVEKVPGKSKKSKGDEYDNVKVQLQEVEEAVMQLVGTTNKLSKNAEECLLSSDGKAVVEVEETGNVRRRVSEQARQGSEMIGRLQLEVQKIQFGLLKFENGRRGKTDRSARVLLRDFIYRGSRNSLGRKKAPCCACVRPSTEGE